MPWVSTGKTADGATLDELWRQGTLREEHLTPEKAAAIKAHRDDWKAGEVASNVLSGFGHMVGRGVDAAKRGMASPKLIPLALAEGTVRGTMDMGQWARDLKAGWVDDPSRVRDGEDESAVFRDRLIEQRKTETDRANMAKRSDQGWLTNLATYAAHALGASPETAAKIGEKFEADPQLADAASDWLDAGAVIPAGMIARGGRAAQAARKADVAAQAARAASRNLDEAREAFRAGSTHSYAPVKEAYTTAREATKTAVEAVKAAQPKPGLAGKATGLAGKALGAVGDKLDDIVPAVERVEPAARAVQIAAGVAAGLPHGLLAAAGGGFVGNLPRISRGVEKAGRLASRSGQALQSLAKTDPLSRMPIWMQLAKDPDAPAWLKSVAATRAGRAVEGAARVGGAGGKGMAAGAAIGGGMTALDPNRGAEDVGQAIGAGMALGGAGGLLGYAVGKGARRKAQKAHDKLGAVDKAITAGADPVKILAAPDNVLSNAAILERLFKGALPGGKDLNIVLLDAASYKAKLAEIGREDVTQVAEWNPETGEAWVNVEYPDPNGRMLHEVLGHALMDTVTANNPDIVAAFDSVMPPERIARAKRLYALQLGLRGRNLRDYVAAQDARNPQWIYGELAAESMSKMFREADILDPTDRVFGRPAARQTGLFTQNEMIQRALTDPLVQRSLERSFSALRDYAPGVGNKATDPVGAPMRAELIGKHQAFPVADMGPFGKGNEWFSVTDTGRVVQRPPRQIRKIRQSRAKEAEALAPSDAAIAPHTDADPYLKRRMTAAGRDERSGTKLPEQFYDNENSSFGPRIQQIAKDLEAAIEIGEARQGWYQQVGKGDGGDYRASVRRELGNLEAQHKEFIPFDFWLTKKNNLLVRNYSLSAFARKAREWAGRQGDQLSLELWNGDIDAFRADVATYLANHRDGLPGENGIGQQKRDLINAFMSGTGNRFVAEKNPLRAKLRGSDRAGLVRSYRLDRLATVEPLEAGLAKPDRAKQLQNLSPPEPSNMGDTPKGPWHIGTLDGNAENKTTDSFSWDALAERLERGEGGGPGGGRVRESLFGDRDGRESWPNRPVAGDPGVSARLESQKARLIEWAKGNGWYVHPSMLVELAGETGTRSAFGSEHDVWISPDGRTVLKATQEGRYSRPDKTPNQYLEQMEDFNSVVSPDLQRHFVGVSEYEPGSPIILSVQPFARGKKLAPKRIKVLMDREGWEPLGLGTFRHRESGVVIRDAHEGNVVLGPDGRLKPFDVWVEAP